MADNCTIIAGVALRSDADMVVKAHRERPEGFEPEALAAWHCLAAEAHAPGLMIDVGAYTGIYTIMARKLGAAVVGFEPNLYARTRAIQNLELNKVYATIVDTALWSEDGPLKLYGARPLTSASTLIPNDHDFQFVTGRTLDSYNFQNVRAVKIDAERAEPQILAGAMRTLRAYLPAILIEVLDGPEQIRDILEPLGYIGRDCGKNMMMWEAV